MSNSTSPSTSPTLIPNPASHSQPLAHVPTQHPAVGDVPVPVVGVAAAWTAAPLPQEESFVHCYQNFVGTQPATRLDRGSPASAAQSEELPSVWLSHPLGRLSVIGLGGLAVTLMAGQLLPQTAQPQAAAAPGTVPASQKTTEGLPEAGTAAVIAPSWSKTEFSSQTATAKDLKFLADLRSASEAGPSMRPPLPGQMLAQQLPSLNLRTTPTNFLPFATPTSAVPKLASSTVPSSPAAAPAAAPIRVEAGSPLALAIAPPETTPMMSLSPTQSLSTTPLAEKPVSLSDRPTAQLQAAQLQTAQLQAAQLQAAQLQAAQLQAAQLQAAQPRSLPPQEPAIAPASVLVSTSPLPLAESTFNMEGLYLAPQVAVNNDAALAATLGAVFDASLERAVNLPGNAAAVAPEPPAQPTPLQISQVAPSPARLAPANITPGMAAPAKAIPVKLSDPAVQSWLSRPVPANQPRQIAALPLTARATIEASAANRLENLWVLHVSAQDYQQIWTVLASANGRSAPAPEYGFIDYQRQAIIVPVV